MRLESGPGGSRDMLGEPEGECWEGGSVDIVWQEVAIVDR